MTLRDPRRRILIVPDLTPEHKDKTKGVHGIGSSGIDSIEDREASVGRLAYLVSVLVEMLINAEVLDRDFPSEDDDLDLGTILEELQNMAQ